MKGATTPRGIVADRIMVFESNELLAEIMKHFTARELMALRPVCSLFHNVATRYLWTRHMRLKGVSSVLPAQGTKDQKLYAALATHLASQSLATGSVRIASDQVTDASFFRDLLGPMLKIKIQLPNLHTNVGSVWPKGQMPGDAVQIGPLAHGGKAHTKFISGGGSVFLGSPNMTPNALSGNTVESGVIVHNPQVQAFFNRYFDLMRRGSQEEGAEFARMLQAFNSAKHPMRLALAPFVEIQPWLLAELQGYNTIVIRMFLISHLGYGADIVGGINALARNNRGMTVDVYVDAGQYENTKGNTVYMGKRGEYKKYEEYVKVACAKLAKNAPNVRIFTQARATGIMHDKLILAEQREVEGVGEAALVKVTRKRAILGSSGFSTHVMHNVNFDLMVAVDEDGLYDFLMDHHQATLGDGREFPTKRVI